MSSVNKDRDPYFWMKDRSNPRVIEYLKRENEYTEQMMMHTHQVREKLYNELLGRIGQDDRSVPYRLGRHWYYYRTEVDKQYNIYCRALESKDGPEEILLDLNQIAEGHAYCDLGDYAVSPDQKWLAYTIDTKGKEKYTLFFRNLETGEVIDEQIKNVHLRIQWLNDSRTIFYTTLNESLRPYRLHRHTLGTDQEDDVVLFEENDSAFRLLVGRSRSRKYIFLRLESQITTEVHVFDADDPQGRFKLVRRREEGVEYYLLHRGERFFILTNDEAVNFRMMTAPVDNPSREQWTEFIGHRESVMIEDAEIFINHLVLFERIHGMNTIRVIDLRSGEDHYIAFEEQLLTCWSGKNPQYDTDIFRLIYSSLVTPETVISYNMDSREREVLKVEEVVGGYDPSRYESKRIYATAKDGTAVPISMVYRKGIKRDGSNAMVLYGYGAYGTSSEPEFWSGRLSLLDRGFIYAIAHVRGGSELGREWYEDGKLLSKMNSFTDFIACAEYLIAEKYTSPDYLVIEGTSAGGLLIGTVANMRPDLFQAAIADVPFVDVVNTMMDESIPRTVTEFDEWGNPVEDRQIREYLRSYSPYDNVSSQEYPNILITTGINDPRVHYWEPAKWAARLRALKTDDNLLLLRTNFKSGHFGPTGRFDYLKEFAFELAFIFDVLGVEA